MAEIPERQAFAIDYEYEFELLEALVAQGSSGCRGWRLNIRPAG